MIDLAAARAKLTEVLERITVTYPAGAGKLKVYPRAVDRIPLLPCAVIGLPDVEYLTGPCMDTTTLPIGVAVGRDGTDDPGTQKTLEELWLEVAATLNAAIDAGDLNDVAAVQVLKTSEFDPFQVHGQTYPAQTLTIALHG